jgi:prepilin signal peptidase PulO-like enzyme (type II secretory pathway)
MTGALLICRAFLVLIGPFAGDYAATFAVGWPRLPRPIVGRSECAICGAPIAARDAVPVISWLAKRGARSCCGGRIPIAYPLGEVAGLISGLAAVLAPTPLAAAWVFALGLTLTYIALVDLRRFSIPVPGLMMLGLLLIARVAIDGQAGEIAPRLATAAVLALAFAALRRLASRGGRAGLGGGDIVLAAVLGALVNWRLASVMVSLAAAIPLLVQYTRRQFGPTPFGFWLSSSAGLLLLVESLSKLIE